MRSDKEKLYTSNSGKLLNTLVKLNRTAEVYEGKLRPIEIQIALTNKCSLDCVFCSVKKRDKTIELDYDMACQALLDFTELGAKSVVITGGGDPTLHPKIEDFIIYCNYLGLKVGLITNGVKLKEKIKGEVLAHLTWVRVSLNSLDYLDNISIPELPNNVTLGFSYVWNEFTNRETLFKIRNYALTHKVKYVRIVPDCRNVKLIKKYSRMIQEYVKKDDLFFFQTKETVPPDRCFIGYLKPFVNVDGWVYHCSANPLIDLKFNESFRMCRVDDINGFWGRKAKSFKTKKCGECFYKEHHDSVIEPLMMRGEHSEFI